MSTLSVTTIETANSTTDLTLKIGNTSGPEIVLAANGSTLFNNVSTLSIGNSTVNTVIASTGIALSEQILTGNVTPTAIAANTNDWNPGITGIYQVRTSANTDGNINYNITGLDGGVNGQVIIIQNIGVGALILKIEMQIPVQKINSHYQMIFVWMVNSLYNSIMMVMIRNGDHYIVSMFHIFIRYI